MTLQPPFALFVIDKDINTEYINESLTRAWIGNFQAGWQLWVATKSYADIPKVRDDNGLAPATEPPLPDGFSSPWVSRSVEDCAKWLQQAPQDSAVNSGYFVVMNEFSIADDTVLVCRIKSQPSGNINVEYFPQSTDTISMEMWTNGGLKWDEKATNYQRSRMTDGKPDRSRAGPYQ